MFLTTRWGRALAGTAALLFLSAAAAQADPHPAAPAGSYQFVSADSVPAAQLEHLGTPQPIGDYQRTRNKSSHSPTGAAPASVADEPDLRTQCSQAGNAGDAKTTPGWVKSRFETCVHRPYDLVLRSTDGKETIGRLWFDLWILGFSYDGDRRVDFVASVEDIRVQTAGSEDATKWRIFEQFTHSIGGSGDPNPQVAAPKQTERDGLLGEWNSQPQWVLKYTSPDGGPLYSQGNQQRVQAVMAMSLSVSSPTSQKTYQEADAFYSSVRFDYAGPVAGKYKGTVFTLARVTFRPRLDDPRGWETARHIDDALHHPNRTFPASFPKYIPGERDPLHRVLDPDRIDANRRAAIATCKDVWGDYDGTKLNCDEYPFASTYEGSAKGDKKYSARLIDADDNQKVGRDLNDVYTLNRVLDNDAFYVEVGGDPTVPPPHKPDPGTKPQPRSNDLNGDGKADLVAIDSSGKLYLYPGRGDGTIGDRITIGTGGWGGASISHRGDWTGDGREDLIALVGGELRVYPGQDGGTLGQPMGLNGALGSALPGSAQVVSVGDINGDGYPDLVAKYNDNLWLYAGDPAAKPGVKPAVKLGAGWNPFTLSGLGTSAGGKTVDLLARDTSDGRLWRYPGTGEAFGNRTLFGTGGWSLANRPLIAAGDDADGNTIPDLWATTGDGKLLFYSGARDASGNPTNGASIVVGSSGWNEITAIS
ncbi:FG-GAP-like repeat-containing protein [Streptomyces hundungensis]|uniref:FG-GAP-like repeat-containing protein n=1 Tax=Streptomyces hundungensis TaxID=1077946 RepID=UPI0033F80883